MMPKKTKSILQDRNALIVGLLLSITAPENRKDECMETVNELLDQMVARHRAYLLENAMQHAENIMKRPSDELTAYLAKEVNSAKKGST